MKKRAKSTVATVVLEQIQRGDITMRPRYYFWLLSAASLVALFAATVLLASLISIVLYWLRIQTADTFARGARANLSDAINTFPWWAVPVGALAFIAAIWLTKKYGRMYRYKISTITLFLSMGILVLGIVFYAISAGSLHESGQQQNTGRPGWQRMSQ